MILQIIFWLSVAALSYHVLFYGVILYVINLLKKDPAIPAPCEYPSIIVLCAAFNEEISIEEKILSFLSLDYPAARIRMIVISDDSTDATNDIVSRYIDRNIELVIQKPRAGKQSAHNLVLPQLDCDYVLSTDANSIFDPSSVKLLVRRMLSSPDIGLVSGELRLLNRSDKKSGEGLYWRYESFLKRMDSGLRSIAGANGSIFLIRRALFTEIDRQSVDDFERTLNVLKNGYRAVYEPRAIVWEDETERASEEISRKIRIISQEWFAIKRHAILLNPFRFPVISFILYSHKILRWLFFIFVAGALVSSAFLTALPFYCAVLVLQLLVIGLGMMGLVMQDKGIRVPGFGLLAYYIAMVYSSAVALKNFMVKKNFGMWKPIR